MKVDGRHTRSIWPLADASAVEIIDQTRLPFAYQVLRLRSLDDAARAIREMRVRGAPLIGVTAAYGVALALAGEAGDAALHTAIETLRATRPTAVNLRWALARMHGRAAPLPAAERFRAAWDEAGKMADEDVDQCRRIGEHGASLLQRLVRPRGRLAVMTHCNAGWLATVDVGTALAPIFALVDAGLEVEVWVSETRPRNQGLLTAWELRQQGVPHTLIADNAAGVLLTRGEIDAVIVGADCIAANGDVVNKVGTWLKALAAQAAGVPFYVAAPRSTIDFGCPTGREVKIEERDADELRFLHGINDAGQRGCLRQLPAGEAVANPAFDVTPAGLVDALITERGCCPASAQGLQSLYPEAADG